MGCCESKGVRLSEQYEDGVHGDIHLDVTKNRMEEVKAYLKTHDIDSDILQCLSTDPSQERETISMANLLISHGADVNSRNEERYTPLHNAVSSQQKQLTQCLLDNGAKVHQHNVYNEIPLHHACARENIEIATLLLERKSRINEVSRFGSPLHQLCANEPTAKTKQMCEFLINNGADIRLQCDVVLMPSGAESTPQRKTSWTPLHVAYWANNNVCADILKQHGADSSHHPLDAAALRAQWSKQ